MTTQSIPLPKDDVLIPDEVAEPIEETPAPAKTKPVVVGSSKRQVELGVMALAFGVPLWWTAARFTMDGWIAFVNLFLAFVRVPLVVPVPVGWWSLIALAFGYVYSRSEITHIPLRRNGKKWVFLGIWALLAWLFVIATDVGSTYLGVTNTDPGSPPLAIWLARTFIAAAVTSVFLTFIPDRLILWGARQIGLDGVLRKIGIR